MDERKKMEAQESRNPSDMPPWVADGMNRELSDDDLAGVSGGWKANGTDCHKGDTYTGKCSCCKKETTFVCAMTRQEGSQRTSWWQCSECGSVWRWDPGLIYADWGWTRYKNLGEVFLNDTTYRRIRYCPEE